MNSYDESHQPLVASADVWVEDDAETTLLSVEQTERPKPPPMYAVFLLNDDFTPMEFVVAVLQSVFNKNNDEAMAIMLTVHHEGRGLCAVYTQDIAQTKVAQVLQLAAQFKHPLLCVAQPIELD